MDVFIEYMVKRKKTALDYAKIFGIFVFGFVLIGVVSVVFAAIPFITSFILLAIAAVIYAMYFLISSVNVEYEYILTNVELDVDSIMNQKRRKRLATFSIKQLEAWGKGSDHSFSKYMESKSLKKIYACIDAKDPDVYFVVYNNDDEKAMLLFNPNEKILKRIEFYNPQRGM